MNEMINNISNKKQKVNNSIKQMLQSANRYIQCIETLVQRILSYCMVISYYAHPSGCIECSFIYVLFYFSPMKRKYSRVNKLRAIKKTNL